MLSCPFKILIDVDRDDKVRSLIRFIATTLGIITISAPIISVLQQTRRPKGRSSGKAAGYRNWFGVLVMMAGFVGLGMAL